MVLTPLPVPTPATRDAVAGLGRFRRPWLVGAAVLAALTLPATLPAGSLPGTTAQAATPAWHPSPRRSPARRTAPGGVVQHPLRQLLRGPQEREELGGPPGRVVDTILGQDLDVLAIQEASQGQLHDEESEPKKISQYDDLVARLGGAWAITNATRYNCVKDTSPNSCTYAYKGASEGQRILYDSARVELVAQGSKLLPVPKGKGDNYMTWAELRQLSTGKRFLFSNLHTVGTDKDYKIKNEQAKSALAEIKAHNPDEPAHDRRRRLELEPLREAEQRPVRRVRQGRASSTRWAGSTRRTRPRARRSSTGSTPG